MKANYKKRKEIEGIEDNESTRKIYLESLSGSERNKTYSEIVRIEYEELLKINGEEEIIGLFKYMLSTEYLMKHIGENSKKDKRLIKEVGTAIQFTVKNIISEYLDQQIDTAVEKGAEHGKTRREVIGALQQSKHLKKLLDAEKNANEFGKIMITQIKEAIKKQEQLIEIEERGDREFLESVSGFTDNYSFLADYRFMHTAKEGNVKSKKFKDSEQYMRFLTIQDKVKNTMIENKLSESGAIDLLLKEEIDRVEKEILMKRQSILSKKKKMEPEDMNL